MILPFDIFRVETDGNLEWHAVAEALNVARLKIKALMDELPGDYVICSQRTGHKIFVKADGSISASPRPTREDR